MPRRLCCPYGRISASHTLDQLSPTMWTQDLNLRQPAPPPLKSIKYIKSTSTPLKILENGGVEPKSSQREPMEVWAGEKGRRRLAARSGQVVQLMLGCCDEARDFSGPPRIE